MNDNNFVSIVGTVVSNFEFNHEVYGEKFYQLYVSSNRLSGATDILPVLVSSRIIDVTRDLVGLKVEITGTFRSFNKRVENKNNLVLFVFADTIAETDRGDENNISIIGYICRKPSYRRTPNGREISDVLLGVNRPYGKSDYLPVITWSRNAIYVAEFETGTKVSVVGRIQSRGYMKPVVDGLEPRIAYEVSASYIEVCPAAGGDCNGSQGDKQGQV